MDQEMKGYNQESDTILSNGSGNEVLPSGNGSGNEGLHRADIWSFGITALGLAHGHAPFSKYPPMKVLMMTIQNAPPGFDYDRDKKFSKSFKEMVAMCLVKDPTKRPTVDKLLKHSFFKHAKSPELCVKKLSAGLPALWDRLKAIQLKDAAQLAMRLMPSTEEEAMSQDADSFARRAEMYYKKRPELMKLVEEFYRVYRALAERYDHVTGVIHQAHKTMGEAFPNQILFAFGDESPSGSSITDGDPRTPEMSNRIHVLFDYDDSQKDAWGLSSSHFRSGNRNEDFTDETNSVSSKKGSKICNYRL